MIHRHYDNDFDTNYTLTAAGITLDTRSRSVMFRFHELRLRRKEYEILHYLLLNQGRPISIEEFNDNVWRSKRITISNTLCVHIHRIRGYIKDVSGGCPIISVYGKGYMIT